MRKRFAIAVPIGAWHPLLPHCLQSLACQSDLVEIAVLDASHDVRVCELLDKFNKIFAYRRTGSDAGQSDAIIEGWHHTTAPILGWLNADDALYPNALASVAEKFQGDPEIDLVYGDSIIIDDDFSISGYHWAVEPPSEAILSECIISQPSCFFRRQAVEKIGGLNRDLHYTMDWDLWVRLWHAGAKFAFIEDTLSKVLWSRDAKTGGYDSTRRAELNRIIQKNSGLTTQVKSNIGFALHFVFEYLAPKSLSRRFRQINLKNSRTINGLSRTGGISGPASLKLVHYGEQPAVGIEFEFQRNPGITVTVNNISHKYSDDSFYFQLSKPAPACSIIDVELTSVSSSVFIGCQLIV